MIINILSNKRKHLHDRLNNKLIDIKFNCNQIDTDKFYSILLDANFNPFKPNKKKILLSALHRK